MADIDWSRLSGIIVTIEGCDDGVRGKSSLGNALKARIMEASSPDVEVKLFYNKKGSAVKKWVAEDRLKRIAIHEKQG